MLSNYLQDIVPQPSKLQEWMFFNLFQLFRFTVGNFLFWSVGTTAAQLQRWRMP